MTPRRKIAGLLSGTVRPYPLPGPARDFTDTPSGLVLWSGLSLLDGRTLIDCIMTGLKAKSGNVKTGAMLQTQVIRHDMDPRNAIALGLDAPICGDCKHRPHCEDCEAFGPFYKGARCEHCGGKMVRPCYVKIQHAPTTTYKVRHGVKGPWARNPWYPLATPADLEYLRTREPVTRFGSYGDPAAVPTRVWAALASVSKRWTGYTHAWRTCDPDLARYCMASVDTEAEYAEARAAGWRTFRVRTAAQPVLPREVVCPAAKEAGQRVTCFDCSLCMGTTRKAKDIVIVAHGNGASAVTGNAPMTIDDERAEHRRLGIHPGGPNVRTLDGEVMPKWEAIRRGLLKGD